jgi:hypothetical protein
MLEVCVGTPFQLIVQASDARYNGIRPHHTAIESAPLLDITVVNWSLNLSLSEIVDLGLLDHEDVHHGEVLVIALLRSS